MRKCVIINQKGGTGKTTTAINLAGGLAEKGLKVLLIDMDPQGNCGVWFNVSADKSLYHLLVEDDTSIDDIVCTVRKNLDFVPSNRTAAQAEIILTGKPSRERVLKRKLTQIEKLNKGYDITILDCAPSLNLLNQNAIIYAEEAILPVSMDYLALVGIKQILENLKMVREILEHEIEISLVIPTFFDARNNKSHEILESLINHFNGKVTNPIRTNVRLSEAASYNQTIFEYAPKSHGAHDYSELVERVIKND